MYTSYTVVIMAKNKITKKNRKIMLKAEHRCMVEGDKKNMKCETHFLPPTLPFARPLMRRFKTHGQRLFLPHWPWLNHHLRPCHYHKRLDCHDCHHHHHHCLDRHDRHHHQTQQQRSRGRRSWSGLRQKRRFLNPFERSASYRPPLAVGCTCTESGKGGRGGGERWAVIGRRWAAVDEV